MWEIVVEYAAQMVAPFVSDYVARRWGVAILGAACLLLLGVLVLVYSIWPGAQDR